MGAGVVEHRSPGGGGGLDAKSEEAQGGFGEDGSCHTDGGLDEKGLDDVGQDVAEQEADVRGSERASGLDEFAFLHGHDLRTNEASVVDPSSKGEGEDEIRDARAEEGDYGDGKKDSGQGKEGVGEVDVDESVNPTTVEPGDHAEDEADQEREGDDGDSDGERDACTVDGSREDVATEFVGSEPVG